MKILLGIFPVDDTKTPPPFKNDNLGLLHIRILHLRKRREKSFPTLKMFLVLKLCRFKVTNLPVMDLWSNFFSFILGDRALIFGPSM